MKKKMVAWLLAFAMVAGSGTSVMAATETKTGAEEEIAQYSEDAELPMIPVVTPTPTQVPDPTVTPTPTQALDPTVTPTPTQAPDPTVTPTPTEAPKEEMAKVSYRAHVSKKGWMTEVSDGAMAGTTGQKLQMEALEVTVTGVQGLGISYSTYAAATGWKSAVSDGATAGTTGRRLAIEAVRMSLTGEKKDSYTLYYRVHVAKLGWLDWASDAGEAGTLGYGYDVQAIEIRVLPKASAAPGSTAVPVKKQVKITAAAHVSKKGWMQAQTGNRVVAGTTGLGLNMEAIGLSTNGVDELGIAYRVHVSKKGWVDEVSDSEPAGTTGQKLSVEAIEIRLTGKNADQYTIYYRAHVHKLGWLDWAANGETAGTTGLAYGVQAVEIYVAEKGAAAPGATTNAYVKKAGVSYRTYVRSKGWTNAVSDGTTAGTTGKKLSLESLQIKTTGAQNLGISYNVYINNVGWTGYVSDYNAVGNANSNQAIGGIQIRLTGSAAKYYNVWYRVHSDKLGWLDWAANGAPAGTSNTSYGAQAVQIVIRAKGADAPGKTTKPYVDKVSTWTYINGYRRYIDAYGNLMNDVSSIFNPSSKYITVDRVRGITTIYGYNSATNSYDTPIKSMWCSVGKPITLTKAGTYHIGWQLQKKEMNASDGSYRCWASYVSQIYGAVYFHGVASNTPDLKSVSAGAFNALGTPQSHGCVRLAACDAKWIYQHVKSGTTVQIGDSLAAPLTPVRYTWSGGSPGPDPTYS